MRFPWMWLVAAVLAGGWTGGEALAQGKKKKKKKEAATDESGGEAADASTGGRLHAKQGGGGPYVGELGVTTFQFVSGSGEATPEAGDASKFSSSNMSLEVEYLHHLLGGKLAVGPSFSYESDSETTERSVPSTSGTGTTTESVEDKDSELGFGVSAKYYIFDVNKDVVVPFAAVGFQITSGSGTRGDDSDSSSGTVISLGGGINYFLTPHAALLFALAYQIDDETQTSKTTIGGSATGASTEVESKNKSKTTAMGLLFGLSEYL